MNFQVVPKYKKYNKTLNQVFFASVPPAKSPGSYSHDDLPVPIRINTYKPKNRTVAIRKTVAHIEPPRKNTGKFHYLKKSKESYDDAEKGCGLSRWCAKRRALKAIEKETRKQDKRAQEWQNWKYKEAERVRQAKIETERLKREAEYIKQLAEIEEQKRNFIKMSSKTRFPFPSKKRAVPKESFTKDLPTDPYYPKKISLKSSYDYLVEKSRKEEKREAKQKRKEKIKVQRELKRQAKQNRKKVKREIKREAKQKRKEEKRVQRELRKKKHVRERDIYPEVAQHSKCSKIRTCLNNFCSSKKKKKGTPYTDTYKTDYSKPETSKTQKKKAPYIDPYENYYDTSKNETPYVDTYDKSYDKSKKDAPYSDTYENYYDKYKKETPYTEPYQAYYDSTYDKSNSKKNKRKESVSDDELYDKYQNIYGGKSKGKRMKRKRKISEPTVDKRRCSTERSKYSRMFVNCFYRACCECYCWFSLFLLVGFAIIMVV